MSEHMFGLGKNWLDEEAVERAMGEDADDVTLVNYTDAQCNCGYGCAPYTCTASRRHWFATRNNGEPFNSSTEARVLSALKCAGIRP
jgi:hypothetical protein